MHLVASQTHFDMVKWIVSLIGEKGLTSKNHLGRNPLHMACQAGCIESLEYLVECGGDLTAVATNGDTPLHVAVAEGHIKMTNDLINLGADYAVANKVLYFLHLLFTLLTLIIVYSWDILHCMLLYKLVMSI